jgi:hypothetical protein
MSAIEALGDHSLSVVAISDHPLAVGVRAGLADCFVDVVRFEMRYPEFASGSRA